MLYNFMELPDGTIIRRSNMINGKVGVYIETSDEKHATCWLPEKRWEDIYGYTDKEFEYLKAIVESMRI